VRTNSILHFGSLALGLVIAIFASDAAQQAVQSASDPAKLPATPKCAAISTGLQSGSSAFRPFLGTTIPANAPIEGQAMANHERHAIVADKAECWLSELSSAYPQKDRSWSTGSGAVTDVADNGSSIFLSGDNDARWNSVLRNLSQAHGPDLEVVGMMPVVKSDPTAPTAAIHSFRAEPSGAGKFTLSWEASNASYFILDPQPRPVRGTSLVVAPEKTTTYTLIATGPYGRATAKTTVTVE
jgi:hypothetical protein